MKVLCLYEYTGVERRCIVRLTDCVMIQVDKSREIMDSFMNAMLDRQLSHHGLNSIGPRPEKWRLMSYLPECGKARF